MFTSVVDRYIRWKGELGVQQIVNIAPDLHWKRCDKDDSRPLQDSLTNGCHRDMEKLIQRKATLPLICTTWYQPILWIVGPARDWKVLYPLDTVSLYSTRSPPPQQTLRYLHNGAFCPFELLWEKMKN